MPNRFILVLTLPLLVFCCYYGTRDVLITQPSPQSLDETSIYSQTTSTSAYVKDATTITYATTIKLQSTTTPNPHCIAENVCRNLSENSNIFYYNRTNFYALLDRPVNFNATITHPVHVVPRIVHFVLFSDGHRELKFYSMLAILAASRFVKPEKIFFWHDNLPIGKYWEETQQKVDNLYLVRRPRPRSIYGKPVKVIEHVADIVRLEALLEFGGMFFDTDAIVVNPIDPILYYDVTMGHAVSFTLANGIMFAKPWSDFQRIWHKEYKNFNDQNWGGLSVIKPKQLSDKYPNLIHIEPTALCRPNWQELGFLFGNKLWDYKKKNFVVHLYMRFARGNWHNPEEIKTWNTTVGSIMRYIYYGNSTLWSEEKRQTV